MSNPITELQNLLDKMEIVDLGHTLEPNIPAWPTQPRFSLSNVESYLLGDVFTHYQIVMSEHTATHMDAPLHIIKEGPKHYGIDQIPLKDVFGRAITIQVTEAGKNGLLTKAKVEEWEKENGPIQEGDIVLVYFGWDKYWAKKPNAANFVTEWPGVAKDAADYFVEKKVKIVGTDVLSIDVYTSGDFAAHYSLLGNGVLVIENMNNLGSLPPVSYFMALPLKIKDGSGSPIRAVALVPKE